MQAMIKEFPRCITRAALDHSRKSKRDHRFRHQTWIGTHLPERLKRCTWPVRQGRFAHSRAMRVNAPYGFF
jgi:hypothetical protein